jgi:cell division protein FtsL
MNDELITYVLSGGAPVIALLLAIIWAGRKGVWHFHSELVTCQEAKRHAQQRADEWQRIALEALGVAEHVMPEVPRMSRDPR